MLAGIGVAGGTASQGVVAFTDAHTDVTGDFTAAGSVLSGSASYDPLGNVLGASSVAGHLGYQSGWTDPVNSRVHMGARWYDPAAGQFTSRDSVNVSPVGESAAANPFAYAGDNPLSGTDPGGHKRVADTTGCTPPPPPSPAPPAPASSCWVCGVVHAAAHWAGESGGAWF